MNIIFLDIDGPLNTGRVMKKRFEQYKKTGIKTTYEEFDPICVKNLKFRLKETSTKIVISSSWRLMYSYKELVEIMNNHGLGEYVIGVTPYIDSGKRGSEIQEWLDDYKIRTGTKINSILILDDDTDMVHLMPYLVQVNIMYGISNKVVRESIKLMKKQKSDEWDISLANLDNKTKEYEILDSKSLLK